MCCVCCDVTLLTLAATLLTKFLKILQNYFFLKPSVTPQASSLLLGAWNSWNARKALAALVLFVGSRYYLRPIILRNHLEQSLRLYLERPPASWIARRALSGYSCITRVRVCDGNAMNVR